ncbi:MAG: hypothetical protein IH614_06655 [Desulfuromonadales bacterium]|nr:hypothetical protein [Desulfuromonadales bacterium]
MELSRSEAGVEGVKYHQAKEGFHVGQVGDFLLHDSFNRPIETIHGQIVTLVEGKSSLYALLRTETGIRPGRLN